MRSRPNFRAARRRAGRVGDKADVVASREQAAGRQDDLAFGPAQPKLAYVYRDPHLTSAPRFS